MVVEIRILIVIFMGLAAVRLFAGLILYDREWSKQRGEIKKDT